MKPRMRSSKLFTCALFTGCWVATSNVAHAVPIVFNLRDTTATAEIESGIITRSGIIATLTPLVQGSSGLLNQTASAFGINAALTTDDSDELDSGAGAESVSMIFNVDVSFLSLSVSLFGSGEQGRLAIAGFAPVAITSTGAHSFNANNVALAGQTVVLSHVAGTGFSFDSFTVERFSAAPGVPETGASVVLLGLAFGGLSLVARFRRF